MRLFKRLRIFFLKVREFRHWRQRLAPFPEIGETCQKCQSGVVNVVKEYWMGHDGERIKVQACHCTNCGPRDHRIVEKYDMLAAHFFCDTKCDNLPKRIKELSNDL